MTHFLTGSLVGFCLASEAVRLRQTDTAPALMWLGVE